MFFVCNYVLLYKNSFFILKLLFVDAAVRFCQLNGKLLFIDE